MAAIRCVPAHAPLDPAIWGTMTFPSYRPLLTTVGTSLVDPDGQRGVARVAWAGDEPVGLALAAVPAGTPDSAELVSILINEPYRRQGLATDLLAGLEDDLARLGVADLHAVYMAGKPYTPIIERLFDHRGFAPPALRKIVVQCTPEEISRCEWYSTAPLPPDRSIFSWVDLPADEYERLRQSQEASPWIPDILAPWSCGPSVDPISSVGLRVHGDVAGWVLTHRVAPLLVRYTACFVRADLQRRGGMFPILVASLERLMGSGVTCTFVTTNAFPEMVRFTYRRLGPFVSYCGETRGVTKHLRTNSPGGSPC